MKECEHKLIIKMHQLEGEKCLIYNNLCEDNPNCYYKKLQRAKEKIKDIAERFKGADREESEKTLCLENDMEDVLHTISEVENERN